MQIDKLYLEVLELLKNLIETPSISVQEEESAMLIYNWLSDKKVDIKKIKNNVYAFNKYFDPNKLSILLNSHHDTVKANAGYTKNPYEALIEDGKIYGLGSNDAGGALVSLIATFVYYYEQKDLKYNLILVCSAEEEISGANGISLVLKELPKIDFAIVGEPTEMNLAIAEKGLLVLDCCANGIASHAAHENSDNAIYNALEDLQWIKKYEFPKISESLGKVKMSVTQINAGSQHNVIPAECHFVIDVRVNDKYTNEEVFEIINSNTKSLIKARSFRLNSSSISIEHPIVQSGIKLGRSVYGSPTLSDQALIPCQSLKIGPGKSDRSHIADEFIYLKEIEEGINIYIKMLKEIL